MYPLYYFKSIFKTCIRLQERRDSHTRQGQRVDTIKREMFSQKSVRRFVGDSSAFVMGAMFLASALNRGIHSPEILKNVY